MKKEDQPDLHPLTAFRYFAALAVLGRHTVGWISESPNFPTALKTCMFEGICGVAFFYVLSGFILTYNYRSVFCKLSVSTTKKFYIARFARIWPVHALTFLLFIPLLYQQILSEPVRAICQATANLTLTQSFVPVSGYYLSYNSVSWSLSNELFFYAVLPFALWGLHQIGWDRLRPAAILAISLWLVALACVLMGRNLPSPQAHWLWYFNPFFRLLDFLIGVALCHVFLALRQTRIAELNWKWATPLELAALVPLAASIAFSSDVPQILRRGVYYVPSFAMLILVFAFQRGLLSRLLSFKLFRLMGDASFSFYMFHAFFIVTTNRYPDTLHLSGVSPLTRILLVFSITSLVSLCCHRWFELPCRDWIKGWFTGRREQDKTHQQSTVQLDPIVVFPSPKRLAS
jgi:peptidoglycan/LPS O-acetylase OafA/YrhL